MRRINRYHLAGIVDFCFGNQWLFRKFLGLFGLLVSVSITLFSTMVLSSFEFPYGNSLWIWGNHGERVMDIIKSQDSYIFQFERRLIGFIGFIKSRFRNLEFQDEALPVTGEDLRADTVTPGADPVIRETERSGMGSSGVTGCAFGRGQTGTVTGSWGRRGFYGGGLRRGLGYSYRRRDGGLGVTGCDGAVGSPSENAEMQKSDPATSAINNEALGKSMDVSAEMTGVGYEDSARVISGAEKNSVVFDSVIGKDDGDEIEFLEEGEVNEVGDDGVLNDELDDFVDFYVEFKFGMGEDLGNEISDEEMLFQEDVIMDHLEDGVNGFDGELESHSEDNSTEFMEVEKVSGLDEMTKADMAPPESDSVDGSDILVMWEGKKKQVRISDPLVGANSKKQNVALLASPRRKAPLKSAVVVKIGGKDKDGKVALPKLPGGP